MVTYQKFVALCFEIKRERGNDVRSLQESQQVLSIASELWQNGKPEINSATVSDAKDYIRRNA